MSKGGIRREYGGRNKEEEKSGKISKTEGVKEKREWIKDGVQRGEKEMELELERSRE